MKTQGIVVLVLALSGCIAPPPITPGVDPAIRVELGKATERKAAEPKADAVEQALLPPLRMEMPSARGQPIDARFDLSVSNAPAQQVFMSIVSGTRYSMLVHPSVSGMISVNMKDVTVREALDSIRELYGYDYKIEGTRVIIHPAGLQTRIFKVNYILGDRRGLSDVRVQSGSVTDTSAGAATAAQFGVPGTGGVVPPGGSTSTRGLDSSRVTTRTQNDFWTDLRTSLIAIVGTGEGRNVVVTANSGVVLVRAYPADIRAVEQYLRMTRISIERQVMLEAKIIDVELNAGFQSGINWAAFPTAGSSVGQVSKGTLLQERPGPLVTGAGITGSPGTNSIGTATVGALPGASLINFALGGGSVFGLALQTASFAALMAFLETQGNAQVLSSPRVATMNNQKAVLKVGTDEFFVTNIQSATTVATVAGTTTGTPVPTVTVQPFFSGIVLDVTPQIDENEQIILHIHPSVSQVTTDSKDIALGAAGTLTLPLAKSNVTETDTVVRVVNGNIVALGGLMKLDTRDSRGGLPGAASSFGGLFGSANKQIVKKEMVILLKTTIIEGDRSWDEGFDQARERFETLNMPDGRGFRQ